MKNMKWTLSVAALAVYLAGCNQETSPEVSQPSKPYEQKANGDTPSVISPADTDSPSPALTASQTLPQSAAPEEVVSSFLDALRAGNDRLAANLLTDIARHSTEREGYVVRPPGTPTAKYQVAPAEFVTQRRDRAHVTSRWTETFGQEEESFDIVWVLQQQDNIGWRITGMRAQLFPGEPMRHLNFENAPEMKRQLAQAEAELDRREGIQRHAAKPDSTGGEFTPN